METTVTRRALGLTTLGAFAFVFATDTAASESPRIELESVEQHLEFLSSDELGGRGNGAEGLSRAASFIAERFRDLGLEPVGDGGSYLQHFRVMVGREVGRNTKIELVDVTSREEVSFPDEFQPMTFSAAAELEASVVFAGYGITAPEHDYDDYGDVDVNGKIVFVLRHVPGQSLDRGPFEKNGWHATFVRKAENALSHGAVGVLIVNGPLQHRRDKLVPFGVDVGAERIPIPVVHLKRERAQQLFRGTGWTLTQLQKRIDENLEPNSFELTDAAVNLVVDVRRNLVQVSNVLGYLPPTEKNESQHLVIGAHYDHLGLGERGSRDRGARGKIHNGADDNASGVAGLLELARLFEASEDRPKGLVFAAFAGEELGLRGSAYYTAHPVYPLEDAVAMVNLDMIGRLRHNRLFIGGVDLIPQLASTIEKVTRAKDLAVTSRFPAEGSSDHAPFIRAGVPALFFFTGLHGDYHKPSDDLQFINLEGMSKVLSVSYEVSDYLLRTPERLTLATSVGPAGGSRYTSRRAAKNAAYFGVGMDGGFQGEGVRFSYVADDGPAAAAGLRAGDVLLELNGQAVRSNARASIILRQQRPGQTIRAKVRRNGEVIEVDIRLARWP